MRWDDMKDEILGKLDTFHSKAFLRNERSMERRANCMHRLFSNDPLCNWRLCENALNVWKDSACNGGRRQFLRCLLWREVISTWIWNECLSFNSVKGQIYFKYLKNKKITLSQEFSINNHDLFCYLTTKLSIVTKIKL